jgi:hypothetical protein
MPPKPELDENGNIIPVAPVVVDPVVEKKPELTIAEQIEAGIAERLVTMKDNMNALDTQKKSLETQVATLKQAEVDAAAKRLREDGKEAEALQLELTQIKSANEVLKTQNLGLTRDNSLNGLLSSVEFRSVKARELAFSEIAKDLIQKEDGDWVGRASGKDIAAVVAEFKADVQNEFLLKPTINSGGDLPTPGKPVVTKSEKSLFKLTQAEVLQRAREGKL